MEKRFWSSQNENFIITFAMLFLVGGFALTSLQDVSLTGMFAKQEPCRLVKDPFSHVEYCRGISSNQFCVWDARIKDCKFVKESQTCNRNNPYGLCSKIKDKCTSFEPTNICRRK